MAATAADSSVKVAGASSVVGRYEVAGESRRDDRPHDFGAQLPVVFCLVHPEGGKGRDVLRGSCHP